jgi:hypothetical protein
MNDEDYLLDTLNRIDLGSFSGDEALHLGKFLAVTMSEEVSEAFVDYCGLNTGYPDAYGSIILRSASETSPSEVLASTGTQHSEYINSSSWNLEEMEVDELSNVVRQVSSELERLQTESPEVTPSGLKGWLRNAELYIGHNSLSFDAEFEEDLLTILGA